MYMTETQNLKPPCLGYAKDLVPLMERILPVCVEKNIKVITNGGGVNPEACRDAIFKVARKLGIRGLKIGIVVGDNILGCLDDMLSEGTDLKNMETRESLST